MTNQFVSAAFLASGGEIAQQIRQLISTHDPAQPICIAVAFWGIGADDLIARSGLRYRVVCNLSAGGTNPQVIRRLSTRPDVELRQNPVLHAKVVLATEGVVISSANFSTNGMGLEGPRNAVWLEAGTSVSRPSQLCDQVAAWFEDCWRQSFAVTESDLEFAERLWSPVTPAAFTSPLPKPVAKLQSAAYRTVAFHARIKPHQRNLRSAAAILALGGEKGGQMPLSPFVFLFSGGETQRAFETHRDKFVIEGSKVRLSPEFVGYFVGTDRTLESASDTKRRRSAAASLLEQVAGWMVGNAVRPNLLEGDEVSACFSHGT